MKKPRKLIWKLYPSYLAVILLSIFGAGALAFDFLKDFYLEKTAADLLTVGRMAEDRFRDFFAAPDASGIDSLCKRLGRKTGVRVTVAGIGGRVLGDSDENPAVMENHSDRPEIFSAISGKVGSSIRHSETLARRMMYTALPVMVGDRPAAVVRVALPLSEIEEEFAAMGARIALGGICALLAASLICLWISRRVSRPMEEMKAGADRFAAGDLNFRLPSSSTLELAALAESMNHMAGRLQEKIRLALRESAERKAILSSMTEGIVALDPRGRALSANRAARDIFSHTDIQKGMGLHEIVRDPALNEMVKKTMETGRGHDGDIVLQREEERLVHVRCAPLRGAEPDSPDPGAAGTLLALSDVTQLRRLEHIRRDFAANVSHELKTPLTAIRGFVETLASGAVESEDDRRRFLSIIRRHVGRLSAIIEDLMALSRIENREGFEEIRLEDASLKDVIRAAVQTCESAAEEKGIDIRVYLDSDMTVRANPGLLERAFVNLMDNAVKFSGEGREIHVKAGRNGDDIRVRFRDFGPGIPSRGLPRLFERFYRADAPRDPGPGGAGLGLAIVKHIALAHGGGVDVESAPGKGSVFTFRLPAA
ncbi:PAS domain-containing sensor histidine kinase [Candidatus Desulfarcum epimagneticum]|uniref:histidine kinase n=1 Tax=uncultured Desulfobacteraceae bacterium TaxID=218296 RepID=A0A484HNQ1_9BACT|nr:PAS domain-containing sensor histidine kinase [uncultured Desulfobacteraceae bacterium]